MELLEQSINLQDSAQLDEIINESYHQPVIIFKHSTRCATSGLVSSKLSRSWDARQTGDPRFYFLDLIRFREISNAIAETFNVRHESPQVLVIRNGTCVYHASHFYITYTSLMEAVDKNRN